MRGVDLLKWFLNDNDDDDDIDDDDDDDDDDDQKEDDDDDDLVTFHWFLLACLLQYNWHHVWIALVSTSSGAVAQLSLPFPENTESALPVSTPN